MLNRFYSANEHYRRRFGEKIYKLALAFGRTCPNRDGTAGTGGCIFCGGSGSGEFAESCAKGVDAAIEAAKRRVASKVGNGRYIAYFQSFTSTYMPIGEMEKVFFAAAEREDIAALSVATRPDCLPDDTVKLLGKLAEIKPLYVELGLQTIHEDTAKKINRGYALPVYRDAVKKLHSVGADVITHIILGLPGESADMAEETATYVGKISDGVKLQLMFVLEGTRLAEMYERGEYRPLAREEYTETLCRCVEVLPPSVVIHRLTGDPPKRLLVAPEWAADKKRVLGMIAEAFKRRNTIQGSRA